MIALGVLLVMLGLAVYGAAKLREPEGRHLPGHHEVERAIEAADDL